VLRSCRDDDAVLDVERHTDRAELVGPTRTRWMCQEKRPEDLHAQHEMRCELRQAEDMHRHVARTSVHQPLDRELLRQRAGQD